MLLFGSHKMPKSKFYTQIKYGDSRQFTCACGRVIESTNSHVEKFIRLHMKYCEEGRNSETYETISQRRMEMSGKSTLNITNEDIQQLP